MDRHLAYVGLTRYRDTATLYAGHDEFRDEAAARPTAELTQPRARRASNRGLHGAAVQIAEIAPAGEGAAYVVNPA